MNRINLRGSFWFILILSSNLFAQETHNLEIIWQKASPESVFAFGRCIASGDVNGDSFSDILIVGDSALDAGPVIDTFLGKCWIFYGGQNLDTVPDICLNNLQKLTFWSLHSGDINGDGFDDVIIGACNNEPSGQVLIFLGGNPMDTICDYRVRGPSLPSVFGCDISSGDVNGDSFADLIVGAYHAYIRPGFFPGRVYIYYGGQSFDTIPDVILNGGHDGQLEHFGITVGSGGDVNNDGIEDIIIGADLYGPGERGRIYIYLGGNPMDTSYDVAMIGEVPNQSLGWTPTVNLLKTEFEYDMAVFGSAFWPYGFPQVGSGKVYVLFGGNPMDSVPDIWMIGRTDTTGLGRRTASAGDINGDFSDDIISGAPTDYNSKGTAYIWLGGTLLDTIPDAWIKGDEQIGGIGWMVASAGDVNGDGKDEIMTSNYPVAVSPKKVWVCKYTGSGIGEESLTQNARSLTLEVNPNPAKSVLRVGISPTLFLPHQWWEDRKREIKIFDVSGKLVKEEKITSAQEHKQEIRISLKGINPGIYFLQVGTEIKKFLVVK